MSKRNCARKDCLGCSHLFRIDLTNQVVFCNGNKGRYIDQYQDREDLYSDFLETERGIEIEPGFGLGDFANYRIFLFPLYICNNDCLICFAGDRKRVIAKPSPLKQLKSFIGKNYRSHRYIDIAGGEPTLYKELPDLIRYCKDKGLVVRMFSNCRRFKDTAFTEEIVKTELDYVIVDFHSHHPSVHDRMTQRRGSFSETLKGLENLKSSGFKNISAMLIIHKLNYKGILQTIRFMVSLGVITHFNIHSLIIQGSAFKNKEGLGIRLSNIAPFLEEAFVYLEGKGERFSIGSFPICLFSKKFRKYFYNLRYHLDCKNYLTGAARGGIGLGLAGRCVDCQIKRCCPGTWHPYFHLFGDNELKPQKEINV